VNRLKWSGLTVALWLGATLPLAWVSTGGTRASFSDSQAASGQVDAAVAFGGVGGPTASVTATPPVTRTATATQMPSATRTATLTPSVTRTAAATRTPTVTASVTPVRCDDDGRARLDLSPSDVGLEGNGRIAARIVLSVDGSAERDVLLGLQASDGAWAFDRVEFFNGQVWQIFGGATSTLYLAGDVAPDVATSIPFTLYLRPGWLEARPGAVASIAVGVARRDCRDDDPKHHLAIDIEQDVDAQHNDVTRTVTPTPTASSTPAPTPTDTPAPTEAVTASATPAPSQTPTPTDTPQPTATATPTETPEATATPTPTAVPAATPTTTSTEPPKPGAMPLPSDTPTSTASATPAPSVTPSATSSPMPSG
jgi:hypothetical protein